MFQCERRAERRLAPTARFKQVEPLSTRPVRRSCCRLCVEENPVSLCVVKITSTLINSLSHKLC